MKMSKLVLLPAVILALAVPGSLPAQDHGKEHASAWAKVNEAVALLIPTAGSKTKGTVRFTQMGAKVKVVAEVEGLNPGQKHAMHIHEFGDLTSADGMATGGHYNPEGHEHGLPAKDKRHAGDLGNLTADAQGKARLEITIENVSVAGLKNPIVGRGVIVHAKEDDGGQPTGNAGGRIAQGAIAIVKGK
jgi:Cu-Zn family superoxide dismutase